MQKIFYILVFFSTFAVATQGVFEYKTNKVLHMIAEEVPYEEKFSAKNKSYDPKEKYFDSSLWQQFIADKLRKCASSYCLKFSKGFIHKPYLPPETV